MKVIFTHNAFIEDHFYKRDDYPQDYAGDPKLLPKTAKIVDKPVEKKPEVQSHALRDFDTMRPGSDAEQKIQNKVHKDQAK